MPFQTPPITVNRAADELIQALDGVDALTNLQRGLESMIAVAELILAAETPQHEEAVDLLPVWQALSGLTAAVLEHRVRV